MLCSACVLRDVFALIPELVQEQTPCGAHLEVLAPGAEGLGCTQPSKAGMSGSWASSLSLGRDWVCGDEDKTIVALTVKAFGS